MWRGCGNDDRGDREHYHSHHVITLRGGAAPAPASACAERRPARTGPRRLFRPLPRREPRPCRESRPLLRMSTTRQRRLIRLASFAGPSLEVRRRDGMAPKIGMRVGRVRIRPGGDHADVNESSTISWQPLSARSPRGQHAGRAAHLRPDCRTPRRLVGSRTRTSQAHAAAPLSRQ